MITVIASYPLPAPIAPDEAESIFLSTAPRYRDVPGLIRKYYVLSEDRRSIGGIYLWKSRADADALYTEGWKAFVRQKYAVEPSLAYFDCPVVVDNASHEILSRS